MTNDRSGSSDYVVFVNHSSSAAGGVVSTSADPCSLSTWMKDGVVSLGISALEAEPMPQSPPASDE